MFDQYSLLFGPMFGPSVSLDPATIWISYWLCFLCIPNVEKLLRTFVMVNMVIIFAFMTTETIRRLLNLSTAAVCAAVSVSCHVLVECLYSAIVLYGFFWLPSPRIMLQSLYRSSSSYSPSTGAKWKHLVYRHDLGLVVPIVSGVLYLMKD